jgi:hypothetical protein
MSEPYFTRQKIPHVPEAIAAKWGPEVPDEGYTPLPKRLLRCLSAIFTDVTDLQVMLAVVDFNRPNLNREPSYDFLAFTAGIDIATFKKHIEAMQKNGLLSAAGPDEAIRINYGKLIERIVATTATNSPETPKGDWVKFGF